MMCVIPQSDHRPGELVFIAHRTQACGAKHEPLGVYCNFKPNPARRQYPNEMPAGEEYHISRNHAHAAYHAIGPRRGFSWRFPSRSAVAEQFPVGALGADLGSAAPLILAIVPFDQIRVDFSYISKASQLTSAPSPLQWAGKDFGKSQSMQPFLEPARIALATLRERQVCKSCMLARERPGGFTVPRQVNSREHLSH